MVEASDLTCWRASKAGMVLTVSAACLSAKARASSPVFHSLFQLGLRGAPTNACIPGLMSAVGAGNAFAGTSSGARSVAIAAAGNDSNAPQASVLKTFIALSSLLWFHIGTDTCRRPNGRSLPHRARRDGNILRRRSNSARRRLLNQLG